MARFWAAFSACALVFLFCANAAANSEAPLRVLTLAGDTLTIDTDSKAAYIFISGFACKECITALEQSILRADSTTRIHAILRMPPDASVFSKKSEIQRVSSLLESRSFFFDISAKADAQLGHYADGLFKHFGFSITPTLLLCRPGRKPLFITYQDLFGSDTLQPEKEALSRCDAVIRKAIGAK